MEVFDRVEDVVGRAGERLVAPVVGRQRHNATTTKP
jgi:hypothetical protein